MWITFDMFEGRLGQPFDLTADGATIRTELVEATESPEPGGTGPEGQPRLQFSLVFSGPPEPVLPQGTYGLDHAELGHLDMFLVPIGPAADAMRYQAVFA